MMKRLEDKFDAQQKTIDTIPDIMATMTNSNETAKEALKNTENAVIIAKESKDETDKIRREYEEMKENIRTNEQRIEDALKESEAAKAEAESR